MSAGARGCEHCAWNLEAERNIDRVVGRVLVVLIILVLLLVLVTVFYIAR